MFAVVFQVCAEPSCLHWIDQSPSCPETSPIWRLILIRSLICMLLDWWEEISPYSNTDLLVTDTGLLIAPEPWRSNQYLIKKNSWTRPHSHLMSVVDVDWLRNQRDPLTGPVIVYASWRTQWQRQNWSRTMNAPTWKLMWPLRIPLCLRGLPTVTQHGSPPCRRPPLTPMTAKTNWAACWNRTSWSTL